MTETISKCELILNALTDGILVVDRHGIVLYANRAAEQLFERGDLLGTDLAVPLGSDADFQEINLIRRSGIGWAELRSAPITWEDQAAYIISVRDITERRLAKAELHIAATAFESRVGMMIADANVRILRVNEAFTTITGYSTEEVKGKSPSILGSGMHGANFYVAMWESIKSKGMWDGEIWNRRKNGEIYPEHLTITAVKDKQGNVTNYVGALTDSTQRQQTLEQLRSTAIQLEQANALIEDERAMLAERVKERTAQLIHANKAKDSFLATMSHEIRTPLGGLLGMLELLDLSLLDAKQREMMRAARNSGNSLLRIVNDILDWSKIEAGKLELSPQVASLRDTLQDVVDTYMPQTTGKDIQLTLDIDPNLGAAHFFDPLRLSQILNNFTSNALKFTSSGNVQIIAQRRSQHDGNEEVHICVKDSGIGIAPEHQERLFQHYEQASADTARMYGGTGLGLSICRRLAELMGGTLSVESTPGVGSSFCLTISLPVTELTAQHELQQSINRKESRTDETEISQLVGPGRTLAVLMVDDHPLNRMLLKQQLGLLGLHTDAATDGVEALALWQSKHYDLIITDCHMPQMDGYELTRTIRHIELHTGARRIPIIAWTANVLAEEEQHCRSSGMDDILTKPTELAELRAKLAHWLAKVELVADSL